MNLTIFTDTNNLHKATTDFFTTQLQIPIAPFDSKPVGVEDFFAKNTSLQKQTLIKTIQQLYVIGIVDDDAIASNTSNIDTIVKLANQKADYEGLLICAIHTTDAPTRTILSNITRMVNQQFPYLPVTIVFRYDDKISLANAERIDYKVAYMDGDKVGKVSLLRDINIEKPHAGHIKILQDLLLEKAKISLASYSKIYKVWQDVFNLNVLNKKFYQELQHWYFWALKEVHFPGEPLLLDFDSEEKYEEAVKEHKGKNIIRLLTRILFIWFIKEKKLIPDELFDEKQIAEKFIADFTPQKPHGIFATAKHTSKYYRAILQNLFFATLNQPTNERAFRNDKTHQGITQLMRYKNYFKNPEYYVQIMEQTVPFMNGGLFECLDKPHETLKGIRGGDKMIYVDGFSDKDANTLEVPDFLFFDVDEEVDLSTDFGDTGKTFKTAKTRGLIPILNSYKFTITENTPIDEDVALDPELLGKVFENLLASYNPETKTTARKQTGSFYTPREIVNYMVEESLIAYLKNELLQTQIGFLELGKQQLNMFGNAEKKQLTLETTINENIWLGKEPELEAQLKQLVAYNNYNPFAADYATQQHIIIALDKCKILDPACGSGAYPMGILQKMVHILHKIDPNNTEWKQRQLSKIDKLIAGSENIDDADFRARAITDLEVQKVDIEECFKNNELDYGRKLYLIENCIYGVDIQPIATQISKLRFFISLVVDQKVDAAKDNFGIRPLPNLETKFVAANTLVGIDKPKNKLTNLFDKTEIQGLEKQLKKIRTQLFSSKVPAKKRELRTQDKALREQISQLLIDDYGNDTARLLANWDPYDQNTSSPFFDKEWMFDIPDGFDVVIGNPPYVEISNHTDKVFFAKNYQDVISKHYDLYIFFFKAGILNLKNRGVLTYITPHTFLHYSQFVALRKFLYSNKIEVISNSIKNVFENAVVDVVITMISRNNSNNNLTTFVDLKSIANGQLAYTSKTISQSDFSYNTFDFITGIENQAVLNKFTNNTIYLGNVTNSSQGITIYAKVQGDKINYIDSNKKDKFYLPLTRGKEFNKYSFAWSGDFIKYGKWLWCRRDDKFFKNPKIFVRQTSDRPIATFVEEEFYAVDSVHSFINNHTEYSLLYLLAILNSKFGTYIYQLLIPETGKVTQVKLTFIRKLPIKIASTTTQQPFITLVIQILALKKENKDTTALEHQIDVMVYHLYKLTYAEACVIDATLSEADWELYKLVE